MAWIKWCFLGVFTAIGTVEASNIQLEINVDNPNFVLPVFAGPYSDRAASIAPEEYEMADALRELLDKKDKAAVLVKLNEFYDLELSAAMLILKAQVLFSLEMLDQAEDTFLAVLARKPQLIRAHSDIGQLYLVKEDYVKARKHFAKAISLGSNEAIIHGQLGYLNLTLHGAFSAIAQYQQAMALEPENIQWQQGLLASLSQAEMYESAQALLREMLNARPNDSALWLNKAAIALQLSSSLEALASIEMAMLLGDTAPKNIRTATQLHLQLGSYDRAYALMKDSVDRSKIDIATVNQYLTWLGQVGYWSEAAELLNELEGRLKALDSHDKSIFYMHRARIETIQSRSKEAKVFFEQSLVFDPTNGEALLLYAKYLIDSEDYVRAELLYSRAEGIEGSEKRAMLGRAQLYLLSKEYESTLGLLRNVLTLYPDSPGVRDNIEIMENIIRANKSIKI